MVYPKKRLRLESSLGYTGGYMQEWDVLGLSDTARATYLRQALDLQGLMS